MASLHQLLLTSCILFSVATLTTAVPFDRQGLSSNFYTTKKNVSSESENVCTIDDVLYQVGDAIPTASPCEKCVCRPPGFACSIITCEKRPNCRALQRSNQCCPEYKCDCEHDGKVYHNGEKLDNTQNPCKVCFCQGGEIACTVIECYKRDDCVPKRIPGMCCPKYDNCPPRDPARTVSSSFGPPVQPTNFTEAREAPKFREVADDRLNLLGEPEATNQPLPEQPISNIIYDLPQGDDPQANEAYDDSSTSTSTTGFIIYDDGLNSSTTPYYDSYEENSSYNSSNSSTTEGSSTPWTSFPTFPEELLTFGHEWSPSTSSNNQDGSTEFIPTWGNYTAPTSTSTQNTSTSSSSTSTQSTSPSTVTDNIFFQWIFETDETSTSTLSSSPESSHPTDETTSSSTSTFSTQEPFLYQKTSDNFSTENLLVSSSTDSSTVETSTSSTDETSTSTTLEVSSPTTSTESPASFMSGSGDGESYARTSNSIDGSEDYYGSTDNDSSISLEYNSDTSLDDSTTTSDQTTGTTQQEYSSTSDTEVSTQDVTAGQEISSESTEFSTIARTSELDNTGIMAGDMALPDQEASTILTDIWNSGDQSTILPDVTDLKSNKTKESIKVGPSDANDSMEESSTMNDDSSSTATTESSTHSSTGGEYETSTTSEDYGSSSGHTDTEMTTESTISTVVTDAETPTSSSSETSITQASETNTQSTETDSTTTDMSS